MAHFLGDNGGEWEWEGGLGRRMATAFRSGYRSDLKVLGFKEGSNDGGVPEVELHVHKLMLQLGSPVLDEKIAEMAAGVAELVLEAADPVLLRYLIEYFYLGPEEYDMVTALRLLALATAYEVPELMEICEQLLEGTVDSGNVFPLFQEAMSSGHKVLIQRALSYICEHGAVILKKESFKGLSVDCVVEIVKQDKLRVDEMELFDAVYQWGVAECHRQSLDHSDRIQLRYVLEKAIKWIRFPLMNSEDFALNVTPKKILNQDELMDVYNSFLIVTPEKRAAMQEGRFISTPRFGTIATYASKVQTPGHAKSLQKASKPKAKKVPKTKPELLDNDSTSTQGTGVDTSTDEFKNWKKGRSRQRKRCQTSPELSSNAND